MKKLFTTIMFAVSALASANATDYYVSVEGAGNGGGTSWENAWSIAKLVENCNKTLKNGDKVYFAAGTYAPTATLFFNMGVELIGAEGADRTVFTGDTNNDGVADRDRFFNINTAIKDNLQFSTEAERDTKRVLVKNIDFTKLEMKTSSNLEDGNSSVVGALFIQNCGSTVCIEDCNFSSMINNGHGGTAICSKFSRIVVKNCTFSDIKSVDYGTAIRLMTNNNTKGFTTIENCTFINNTTKETDNEPCIIKYESGQNLTISNCYFLKDERYAISNNTATTLINNYEGADTEFPSINVTNVGAATYYLGASFTMPKGLTGKTFASVQDKMLVVGNVYTEGKVVPAGTALLIEGAEGTYNPVLAVSEDVAPEGNLLKGADVATQTTEGESYYKLAVGDSGLGFYWGAPEGAAFESAAHKAYLCLNTAGARKAFFFSGETTGIEGVNGANGSSAPAERSEQSSSANGSSGVKVLKNGRLVIEKGGKTYNAVGAEVM